MSSMAKQAQQRVGLLQGTLDMLILRTLLYGPAHGHQTGEHIERTRMNPCRCSTARSTPRCIGWSQQGGSCPNGRLCRTEIANSNTTG